MPKMKYNPFNSEWENDGQRLEAPPQSRKKAGGAMRRRIQ